MCKDNYRLNAELSYTTNQMVSAKTRKRIKKMSIEKYEVKKMYVEEMESFNFIVGE